MHIAIYQTVFSSHLEENWTTLNTVIVRSPVWTVRLLLKLELSRELMLLPLYLGFINDFLTIFQLLLHHHTISDDEVTYLELL